MRLVVFIPHWISPEFFDRVARRGEIGKFSLRALAADRADDTSTPADNVAHAKMVEQFTAASHSIATGIQTPDNFRIVESLLETGAHALILFSSPAEALAQAALQTASSGGALERWCDETELLLSLYKRYQRNCVLIDADQAVGAPDDFKYFCNDRFGWTPDAPKLAEDSARLSGRLVAALALPLIASSPRARSLVEELEASSHWRVEALAASDAEAAFRELGGLLQDRRMARRAENTIELLRSHLHLVQSRLESHFYETELRAVAAAEKRYDTIKVQKDQLVGELAKLKSSASWKLTAPLRAILDFRPKRLIGRYRDRKMAAIVRDSSLFDAAWYGAQYKDVVSIGIDPALHYIKFGAAEGRAPSSRFNGIAYLAANPDIAQMGLNPLIHYVLHGKNEGRPLNLHGRKSNNRQM